MSAGVLAGGLVANAVLQASVRSCAGDTTIAAQDARFRLASGLVLGVFLFVAVFLPVLATSTYFDLE